MKQDKPLLLSGYFQENLGDDLFFKILLERYPQIKFYTYSCLGFHSDTFNKDNLAVPNYIRLLNPIFSFLLHLLRCRKPYGLIYRLICIIERRLKRVDYNRFDGEVCVTGSCFMQRDHAELPPMDLLSAEVKNKTFNFPNISFPKFIIGANVGPVRTSDYLDTIKKEIETVSGVCFRDNASYNLFSFLPNVRYAPDVIFNLDISRYKNQRTEKQILINLIDLENKLGIKNTDNYDNMIDIIREYINLGYQIKLVSFCKLEKDEITLRRIKKSLNSRCVKLISYNGKNLDQILNEFAKSQYIIAGRFHAMILSMLFEKPFFPICYDDKMMNYLRDLNFSGRFAKIDQLNSLAFEDVYSNFINNNIINAEDQIRNAHHQFDLIDEYFNKG